MDFVFANFTKKSWDLVDKHFESKIEICKTRPSALGMVDPGLVLVHLDLVHIKTEKRRETMRNNEKQ